MKPTDPAYWMLLDEYTTTPTIFKKGCYICEDPEFAQMGLPLCYPCKACGGHVAADDPVCDDCEHECHPNCGHYDAVEQVVSNPEAVAARDLIVKEAILGHINRLRGK
jgi:hypothetical protein